LEFEQYPEEKVFEREDFPVKVNASHGPTGPSFGPYHHPELEFQLIRRGAGQYFIRDTNYTWEKNSVFIIHKNEIHAYIPPDPDTSAKRISLMFSSKLIRHRSLAMEILKQLEPIHHVILPDKQAVMAEFLLNTIAEELDHQSQSWREVIVNHLETFLTMVFRATDEQTPATKTQDPVISSVIKYLDANFPESISLVGVAEHFGLSPYTLSRKFKRFVGIGFREYLIHRRIVEAQKLLEETDMKIVSIGFKVGFDSMSSFYQDFQGMTGLSPSAYRKSSGTADDQVG
jgi:AraC-like DNA-binding protein